MSDAVRDTALRAARLGLCVIPPREDGSKAPDARTWKAFVDEPSTLADVERWYARPRSGVGILGGHGNVELFDFDDRAIFEDYCARCREAGLGELLERVLAGYTEETPAPGVHTFYRCPEPRSTPLAKREKRPEEQRDPHDRWKTTIETKGAGGYAIIAPTNGRVHPSGGAYVLAQGGLDTITTITAEERAELHRIARTFDARPQAEPRQERAERSDNGRLRPGDDYNARASWDEVLEPHGWAPVFTRGGETYWRRPGKDVGISATTNYGGRDRLAVFSTSTRFDTVLDTRTTYSKFEAFAMLSHGGDFRAAARDLGQRGYGEADPEPEAGDEPDPEPAPEPTPFTIATPPNSFVTQYIEHVAERTDASPEAHELMAVATLSALAGPGPRLPLATSTHGERLMFWGAYIVDSTIGRKSTTVGFARDILEAVLGRDAILEWEGSPQGMLQRLQQRDGQAAVFVRDEYSGLMAQMNRGGHMAGLEQLFIRAFDGRVLENVRTRKRNKRTGESENDTDRVERPYLVKLAATTWSAFVERATIDNVLSGFLARFTFVTGAATPRRPVAITPEMDAAWARLIERARAYHWRAREAGWLRIGEPVLDAAWEIEQDFTARARRSARPDAAGRSAKRLADAVLRVAGLLALEDTDPPEIHPEHLRIAGAMGERWLASTLRVVETLGATTFQREADAVAETVRRHPGGVKLSDIYRDHRRLRKRDFEEILDALEMQRVVVKEERRGGRGRPAVVYRPGRRP